MPNRLSLGNLPAAVKSAVDLVLEQKGVKGVDHIWIGFVAPDSIAPEKANAIAHHISAAIGLKGTPSVAQQVEAATGGIQTRALHLPPRIIGLVIDPATLVK